jgi:putative PIN family toxin of toxin-antitoxin system
VKVVLDTNVLLSGLMLPDSTPGRVVNAWRQARFDLVTSKKQLTEIARVLTYPKIHKRLRWRRERVERFLRQLYLRSELVDISAVIQAVPDDPEDQPILASLIASSSEYLVTGDSDLLALADRYPIVTPAEFVQHL